MLSTKASALSTEPSALSTKSSLRQVRKTIGKHFGPKLIDMISISRKNSSEARIFIQFDHEDDKRDVMGKWHRSILGNTSVRDDVKKADNDGVMIRNVPLYVFEVSIEDEIAKSLGREVKVFKMRRRDRAEVRAMKVVGEHEVLKNSLQDGITLQEEHLRFKVELPYEKQGFSTNP